MIKKIRNNKFISDVSTLTLGTLISQAIVVFTSPFLTRTFSVESFGTLSVFTSFTVFFAVLSTGRYELAIGLPTKENDALKLVRLILKIGFFVSIFYTLIIFLFKHVLLINDSSGFLILTESYFAPFYILLIAISSALNYWFQRNKRYKIISISVIIQAVVTTIVSFFLGILGITQGMIIALMIGVFSSVAFFFYKDFNNLKLIFRDMQLKDIAKQYNIFPKYAIISDLAMTANQQFIPVLFSVLFSTTMVGFFSMANRMLRLPNIMITSAISNVFRNEAIDEFRIKGNCVLLFLSTLRKLVFIALPLYIVIYLISPWAFSFFFGKNWLEAGYYAQILCFLLFTDFISSPLNVVFYIANKQKLYLILQVLNTIGAISCAVIGAEFFDSPYWSLALFGLNGIFFNLIFIFFSFRISKKNVGAIFGK